MTNYFWQKKPVLRMRKLFFSDSDLDPQKFLLDSDLDTDSDTDSADIYFQTNHSKFYFNVLRTFLNKILQSKIL
jgi:hypothetical protein